MNYAICPECNENMISKKSSFVCPNCNFEMAIEEMRESYLRGKKTEVFDYEEGKIKEKFSSLLLKTIFYNHKITSSVRYKTLNVFLRGFF